MIVKAAKKENNSKIQQSAKKLRPGTACSNNHNNGVLIQNQAILNAQSNRISKLDDSNNNKKHYCIKKK